ncbi:MAG: UvrD-helicase domain-containing protein, partial [Planctomycetales bacterium]|nr:UvrD-helicase domain-containing protein [Planctomycetales bacterium]
MDDVFASLTPSQCEAVRHVDGPLLMLAGPGSGKTRVVTHRIAHMLQQGVPARQILALTFTNKAADEMRMRVERMMPRQPVWIGTFHRFCSRLLRRYASLVGLQENFSIYDTQDSRRALKQTIQDIQLELQRTTPDQIAHEISRAKNEGLTPDTYEPRRDSFLGPIVAKAFPAYQSRLLASNAVDFDDLLVHVSVLLRDNPELRSQLDERFRYIMVDEYQDTNSVQYAIARLLSIDHPNLAVTGDPDQSIYGWRGASINNILNFDRDYRGAKVVRLEQNWRSTPNILRVADELIRRNVRRKEKTLWTDRPEGRPVRLLTYPSGRDESDDIVRRISQAVASGQRRYRDFAIFYRINALSRALENSLRAAGVPFQIVGGLEFYQRKEVKDVLAYLQLLNNPRDDVAFARVVNTPTRGIGAKTIQRLAEHGRRYQLSMLEAAREAGLIESLSKRAAVMVAKFVSIVDRMSVGLASSTVEETMARVLDESGYRHSLEMSDSEEDYDRLANVEELITAAREFDLQHAEDGGLDAFLEQVALVNETDNLAGEVDQVTLMTLHAAKGLEFPVVFIVALEQGLLPHEYSSNDPDQLEEERRLLFVGITRAEEELSLSTANYRSFRGEWRAAVPSEFLMELPRAEMELSESSFSDYGGGWAGDEGFEEQAWDDDFRDEEPADEY